MAGHYTRYEKNELINKLYNNIFKKLKLYSYGFPIITLTSKIWKIMFKSHITKANGEKNKEELTKKSGLGFIQYFKYKKS